MDTGLKQEAPALNARTSGLATASLAFAIVSPFTCALAAILAIVLGIAALVRINKSQGRLKGKFLAITGISISLLFILVFGGFFVLWSLDAPPIPDDYTIADLRSVPPECNASYELLLSLYDTDPNVPGAPAIGLTAQDVNSIREISKIIKDKNFSEITDVLNANSDKINQIWQNAKKGRDIINKLDSFDQIADLTKLDFETEIIFLTNLRRLTYIYNDYVYLQMAQGNSQNAVEELVRLDSVYRKLSINVRPILTKLVCFAGLRTNISAANFIANNPQTSQKSLQILSEHFSPLTDENLSFKNSFISEYLMCKKIYSFKQLTKGCISLKRSSTIRFIESCPVAKRNSTLRLLHNHFNHLIYISSGYKDTEKPRLSVWPSAYLCQPVVSIDSKGRVPWFYWCYNPSGSLLATILTPAYDTMLKLKTKLEVHDDLLQIILNKRLDKEVNLKARAYSDEYIVDLENKKIFSPGLDEIPDTKDDIKLLINPEILEWNN